MKTTRVLTGTGAGRGIRAVRPLSARARAGVASRGSGHAGRAVARAASSKEDQGEDRMTYAGAERLSIAEWSRYRPRLV